MFNFAIQSYCLKVLKIILFVASTSSSQLDNNLKASAVFPFLLQWILNSPFLHLLETNKYLVYKHVVLDIYRSTFYKGMLQYSSKLSVFYKHFIWPLHYLHWTIVSYLKSPSSNNYKLECVVLAKNLFVA